MSLQRGRLGSRRLGLVAGALVLAVLLGSLLRPHAALAHPLGNFTVNRYARIELSLDRIHVRYVLDMAEIPTFQEMDRIDENGDGKVSEGEGTRYAEQKVELLRQGLQLVVNGRASELRAVPDSRELVFPSGQAGLVTLRLSAWFEAPLANDARRQQHALVFIDNNYSDRVGWKEIVVSPRAGISIFHSSAPSTDMSGELLSYPQDLVNTPLRSTEARVTFELVGTSPGTEADSEAQNGQLTSFYSAQGVLPVKLPGVTDRFASIIGAKQLTIPVLLLSFAAVALWGAAHALSPGHGKTIVAAYLVGARATVKHAVLLGLSVTVTHTLAVFALGLVTLLASRYILPEELFPWLQLTSGVLVVGLGAWFVRTHLRDTWFERERRHESSAHAHVPGGHSHQHNREHPHADGVHGPAGRCEASANWKGLVALGVSGGLLPCPSAILLMLGAILVGRIVFGLALVLAFSVGLASALTGIAVAVLCAQKMLSRLKIRPRSPVAAQVAFVVRLMPVGGALLIFLLGIIITTQALYRF